MQYSICIIDDGINQVAAAHNIKKNSLLNSIVLHKLLSEEADWGKEIPLYELFTKLLNEKEGNDYIWNVYAFTHPEFFLNSHEKELLRVEIIIFDWDFSPTIDQEKKLLEILNKCYSYIYIYSGADKEIEIKKIIDNNVFKCFRKRLEYVDKLNLNKDSTSPTELMTKIRALYKENFSFKFGSQLRKTTVNALDRILIRLGELHIDDTLQLLGGNGEQISDDLKNMIGEKIKGNLVCDDELCAFLKNSGINREISEQLLDLISEKIRNNVISSALEHTRSKFPVDNKTNIDKISQELWAYRLYYNPSDDIVRKGDIFEQDNKFFIVVTADCDLARFWHKNYGYINLLPIHEIQNDNEHLKKQITLTREKKKLMDNAKFNSFSASPEYIKGMLILPFLKCSNGYKDFSLFPQELMNQKIELKEDGNPTPKKERSLKYAGDFKFNRIATISEPFLTPLIQHIFSTISGYGTPDYPKVVSDLISKNFKKIFENEIHGN
ncbi:MAG: hypothetical protein NT166_01050 [Candidatus Aminicenantes bacterium]|nr:hypothetical protein [Candidatus Aminicenantes bacterium]